MYIEGYQEHSPEFVGLSNKTFRVIRNVMLVSSFGAVCKPF
eukprot:UN23201